MAFPACLSMFSSSLAINHRSFKNRQDFETCVKRLTDLSVGRHMLSIRYQREDVADDQLCQSFVISSCTLNVMESIFREIPGHFGKRASFISILLQTTIARSYCSTLTAKPSRRRNWRISLYHHKEQHWESTHSTSI